MFYIFGYFCLFFTVFMAQSKAARQGQRKGKNVPFGDAPPVPVSLGSASIPSIGSGAETMLYMHTNLRLIYRQREDWLKGKTKMWDVFVDDMGLDNSVELALANLDLNAPVLDLVTFDDRVEASFSTPADAEMIEEKDASEPEESSGEHDDRDEDNDADYDDED